MKRNPGAYLREQVLDKATDTALLAMLGLGWLVGAGVTLGTVFGTRLFSEGISLIVLLPVIVIWVAAWRMVKRGWRLQNMKKGARSEEMVGQMIEAVLTRDGCAVAHNVKEKEIDPYGDIDHLVATPRGLWVIETKTIRILKSEFRAKLRIIAANVERVREWAPPDTQVTGCLVFASEQKSHPKPTYKEGEEIIRAFDNLQALGRELSKEVRGKGSSFDLARQVRELGKQGVPDP